MTTPTSASSAPSPRRCRKLFSLKSVEKFINEKLKNSLKVTSARTAFERFTTVDVKAGQGNPEELFKFGLPGWEDMRGGVSIKGQPQGGPYADPVTGQVGGFRPARNELFKKYSTRTQRPVVNFSTCTKCTLCWLNCPDASFDVTPGRAPTTPTSKPAAVAAFARRFAR